MNIILLTGCITITIGIALIMLGLRIKNKDNSIEIDESIELQDDVPYPPEQKKYEAHDVLNRIKEDENFKRDIYEIIKKNKEKSS